LSASKALRVTGKRPLIFGTNTSPQNVRDSKNNQSGPEKVRFSFRPGMMTKQCKLRYDKVPNLHLQNIMNPHLSDNDYGVRTAM